MSRGYFKCNVLTWLQLPSSGLHLRWWRRASACCRVHQSMWCLQYKKQQLNTPHCAAAFTWSVLDHGPSIAARSDDKLLNITGILHHGIISGFLKIWQNFWIRLLYKTTIIILNSDYLFIFSKKCMEILTDILMSSTERCFRSWAS